MAHIVGQVTRNLVIVIALTGATPALGQLDDVAYLQQIGNAAQQLQTGGRGQQMIDWLRDILDAQCAENEEGRSCRLYLGFARGYVLQREADTAGADRQELLQEAVTQYLEVLHEAPVHAATIQNLYLVRRSLGQGREAEELLAGALGADNTGRLAVLAGQLWREQGKWEKALKAFDGATRLRSGDQDPRVGIVDVYRRILPTGAKDLEKRLADWGMRFPDASEAGYHLLLERVGVSDPSIIDRAFPLWVTIVARQSSLSVQRVAGLGFDAPAKNDLIRFLTDPTKVPNRDDWWLQTFGGRSALAEVAYAQGRLRQTERDMESAVHYWETGLQVAPPHNDYAYGELRGAPWVRLDLERELALAYTRHPGLDTGGTKFDTVLEDLYSGKGDAIMQGNLESIQRYHVALGLILAERKAWQNTLPWRSAIYQLQHALAAATERESKRSAAYQPLPEIKAALAEGYEAMDLPAMAASTYLIAGEAYLDMDELSEAERMLTAADRVGAMDERGATMRAALKRIVDRRRVAAEVVEEANQIRSPADTALCGREAWSSTDYSAIYYSKDFLPRQQFKVASDLLEGGRLSPLQAEQCANAGLNQAIDRLGNLVGASDVLRLERLLEGALRHVQVEQFGVRTSDVWPADQRSETVAKAWNVYRASDAAHSEARISADAVLANKIKTQVDLGMAGRTLIAVRNGDVYLRKGAESSENGISAKQMLANIKGVKQIRDGADEPGSQEKTSIALHVTDDMLLNADKDPRNWLLPGKDYQSTRYSDLRQINKDTVKRLRPAWDLSLNTFGGPGVQPIVANGTVYVMTQFNRLTAVDAKTGKILWKYERELPGDIFPKLCCDVVSRGVAVYKNKVYLATLDAHIVALDNTTGKMVWDKKMGDYTYAETFTIMPMALRGKIIFGTAGAEYGVRGWLAAIDADTGAPVWKTYTIPGPGEPGNDTWAGESWKYGGGSARIAGSYDKETNTLYWPVGNPGPDFDRHVRLGDNLFTNSNLMLDPDTGKIKSYFNFTPNDPYNYGNANGIVLVDVGGKKLWVQGSPNGHVYGIDRVNTTKTKYGNEHKCVWVNALQRVNWVKQPINPSNNCKPIYNYPEKDVVYGKVTTDIAPSLRGAVNSIAYSRRTKMVYVPVNDTTMDLQANKMEWKPGEIYLGAKVINFNEGAHQIKAFEAATGKLMWEKAETREITSGILATGGGLVFYGDVKGNFKAVGDNTGENLWSINVGGGVYGNPITFIADGKQYVAIVYGGGGGEIWSLDPADLFERNAKGSSIIVFALEP